MCADAFQSIYEHLRTKIVTGDYIQTGDTPVTVLGRGGGGFTGRLRVYPRQR